MPDDLELLQRFEPVIRFNRGELFYPMSVADYVADSALYQSVPRGEPVRIAGRGELDLAQLAHVGRDMVGEQLYLQHVDRPLTRGEYRAWRKRPDRIRFAFSSRFAAVGLLGRFIDALMRLTLLLRGNVPGGYAAAAQVAYAATPHHDSCFYYGQVGRDGGYVVLQYWYFYAMNDWRSTFGGVNDHEADWEQVTVFLTEDLQPVWVAFSSHDEEGDDLRRRWDDPDVELVHDTHPVVYAGAGSHSGAYLPGEYLISAPLPLPGWVDNIRRWFLKVLPWYTDDDSGTIGIPYIDYKRGDGLSVGPGQDRPWRAVLVDDHTPWVQDFRGLWGLDTQDIFGGERAPAGVRYERNGRIRHSWAQPVAWAGLDKEAPDDAWAVRDMAAAQQVLTDRMRQTGEELEETRETLRAARAAERVQGISPQRPTPLTEELMARVHALRIQQATLQQQYEGVSLGLDEHPLPQDPVHAHLHHRAKPLAPEDTVRGRVLRVWSAASASIMLAGLGVLLLVGTSGLVEPVLWLAVVMILIEATLRRRLGRLLLAVAVLGVLVLAVWAIWALITGNLRVGVGWLLILAALYMVGQTAAEGMRTR